MHKLLPHTPRHHVLLVQLLSHVQLFAIPWTAAHQASLSFTISESLLKLMSIESVMPSNHLILCHHLLFLPSIFPRSRSSTVRQLFASSGQSIGASASAWVLSMNIQDWFSLGLTGLISLLPKGLSRVFSSTTLQFSRSVMSVSSRSHELQHARPPCPLPTPGVYPNSCP